MTVLSTGEVVTSGDRHLILVDPTSGTTRWTHEFATRLDKPCLWVAASMAVGTVYCGDRFGHISELSLRTGGLTERAFEPQLGVVGPLAVTSEGRELVVVGRGEPAVTRWMLDGSGAATRVQAPGWSVLDRYGPGSSHLLVAQGTGHMQTWNDYDEFAVLDTRSGELVRRLPVPSYHVRWAGAGVLVGEIGGAGEEHAAFVDVETGRIYRGDGLPAGTIEVATSTDGRRTFIAAFDGDFRAVDPTTGRVDWRARLEGDPWDVSTNTESTEVLVTTWWWDGLRTAVFDAATGKRLRTAPEGIDRSLYSARNEIIGATFNRITRYDADTFQPIGSLPGVPGGLYSLDISPDGRTLSAYSLGGTISLYDPAAGIRLGDPIPVSSERNSLDDPFQIPRKQVFSGVFSPDGEELAADAPTGIALWDLRPSSHAEAACRMAGRDLTEDEWRNYLGDLGAYRSTCGFADGD